MVGHAGAEQRLGAVAAVAAAVVAVAFALWAVVQPLPVVADDSLFYVEIGSRVANGEGSTFSGLMPTNGYQPLWLAVVSGLHASPIGELDPEARVSAVLLAWCVLVAIGLVLFVGLARRLGTSRSAALAGTVPLLLAFSLFNLWGSEAAVNLVAIVVSATALHRVASRPSTAGALALGAALGFAVLARLDNAVLVVAVLGALVWGRRDQVRRAALAAAAGAAVVAPYAAWNLARFGRPDTIATAIKSDVGFRGPRLDALPAFGWAVVAATVLAGLVWALVRRDAPEDPARDRVIAGLGAACGLHVAGYLLFATATRSHWGWYFVLELVTLAALVAVSWSPLWCRLERWAATPGRRRAVVVAASGCVAVALVAPVANAVAARERVDDEIEHTHDLARTLDQELPATARVLALDLPGVFAVAREGPVVGFDGLTGDFDYQDDLADDGVACTMSVLGIDVVVSPTYLAWSPGVAEPGYSRAQLELSRWIDDRPVGAVEVAEADELARSAGDEAVAWRASWPCP